jgi:RNA polymerase sigma-70 factor, ECF subfamily
VERPRLLGLAYRMTGSYADADDIVQEAWVRWSANADDVERPAAWLTTVVSRLALDRLQSASQRRETYVGPWLAEPVRSTAYPVVDEGAVDDPADLVELAESLRLGFLVLLDRLDPLARVVVLLADVFAVPFDEIAVTVGRSPDACRQIASRARRRLRDEEQAPPLPGPNTKAVVDEFVTSLAVGDIDRLLALSAPDLVVLSDGGPRRRAARYPIVGVDRAVRFLSTIAQRAVVAVGSIEPAVINGEFGLIGIIDGRVDLAMVVEASNERVHRVLIVLNPDKLAGLGPSAPPVG